MDGRTDGQTDRLSDLLNETRAHTSDLQQQVRKCAGMILFNLSRRLDTKRLIKRLRGYVRMVVVVRARAC